MDSHLFLLIHGEVLEDVAAPGAAHNLERAADVVVLVHGLVVVCGGARVLAVDEEIIVHAQVPQVVDG